MTHEWSHYQSAIFDFVANGTGNGVIVARAGCGKTTSLVEAVRRVPRKSDGSTPSVLVLAFNTSIAGELVDRFKGMRVVNAMTTHSYGRRLIDRKFDGVSLIETKTKLLIDEHFPTLPKYLLGPIRKGVSLAKNTLAATDDEIDALIDDYDIEVYDRGFFVRVVKELLRLSAECTSAIDFDDMIWMPIVHGITPAGFDYVFVDELQDLNRCQINLALHAVCKGGRVLGFGDDRQAIYGFRGADKHAMRRMTNALSAVTMPLSVTYRCAKSIVAVANEIVPDLEYAPGAPEGIVASASKEECLRDAQPGDFILSRSNAPLVDMTLSLLAAGRPARMMGRDLGEQLAQLVRKSKADDVDGLIEWIEEWADKQARRLMRKDLDPGPPRDKAECLVRIAEGEPTVDAVMAKLRRLFDEDADDSSRIVLATTHKAKGLERDRVWVLVHTYKRMDEEGENLWYVATTRAKRELRMVA